MSKKAGPLLTVIIALILAIPFTSVSKAQIPTDPEPFTVALADLDGDGNLDLVVGHNGPRVCWYFGIGDGTFGEASCTADNFGGQVRFVTTADVNNDGWIDILVADFSTAFSGLRVLVNNGDSTFTDAGLFTSGAGSQPRALTVADFDGDGLLDAVTSNWGTSEVAFLRGNGDGTFAEPQSFPVFDPPLGIVAEDFNGDGYWDIAISKPGNMVMGYNYEVDVLTGNGDGTFNTQVAYAVGSGPEFLATADFNGDGCPDLASANLDGNSVSVLLNACDGTGTLSALPDIPVGGQPYGISAGDVNLDGVIDLTVASNQSGAFNVLLGFGDGSFDNPIAHTTGGGRSRYIALGDIDNDGISDAVVVNEAGDTVTVLLGNGDGTFRTPQGAPKAPHR